MLVVCDVEIHYGACMCDILPACMYADTPACELFAPRDTTEHREPANDTAQDKHDHS